MQEKQTIGRKGHAAETQTCLVNIGTSGLVTKNQSSCWEVPKTSGGATVRAQQDSEFCESAVCGIASVVGVIEITRFTRKDAEG